MKLYTTQMAKWRKVRDLGIEFYDVTVKSGDKLFAPSWSLLSDYKSSNINEEEYIKRFLNEMRGSFHQNKGTWLDFISKEEVCIACYCISGKFCHRKLLVDIFEKLCHSQGVEFEYKGEIE